MAKQFTVTIETDNAAFDSESGGDLLAEVSRILIETGEKLIDGATTQVLYDVNGNRVGVARFNYDVFGEED